MECRQKIIPISNQKFMDEGVMGEDVLDIKINIKTQKKGITKTEVQDVAEIFVVKFRGLNVSIIFKIHNYFKMKMKIIVT